MSQNVPKQYCLSSFIIQGLYIFQTGIKINKRTSKPKKVKYGKRIAIIFNVIEWSLYIVFSILAALFMKDVWDQYQIKETFMGQSLEPMTKFPSLTLCLKSFSYKDMGKIRVAKDGYYKTLKENETLYGLDENNSSVILHQVSSGCFRLKCMPGSNVAGGLRILLRVDFSKYRPSSIEANFVSEENSYGLFNGEWFDGKIFRILILPGYKVFLELWQNRYTYLQNENQCSNETFVEQWMPHLLKANFSQASKKCSGYFAIASEHLPLCGWGSGQNKTFRDEARKVLLDSFKEFRDKIGHKRPCHVIEYSGEITYARKSYSEKYFVMRFKFGSPGLTHHYTERLVFDLVGMVGSVGGTLGMCIGFSFSGITSTMLSFMKTKFDSYF